MSTAEVFKTAGGCVSAWIEQEDTVHLKAVDEYGDPVELTAEGVKIAGRGIVASVRDPKNVNR